MLQVDNHHELNCDKLSILFIWRRDYLAHPRNPSGFIQRKVQNEQELIEKLRGKFTNYTIRGVQIDLFTMRQQLQFIDTSDILVGKGFLFSIWYLINYGRGRKEQTEWGKF